MDIYEKYFSISGLERDEKQKAFDESYFRKVLLKHIPKEGCILDIGCGYGKYMELLQEVGYENVFGVDRSQEQVAKARELGLEVEGGDACEFLEGKKFDVMLLIDVLEHIELGDSHRLLRSIYESLNEGGKVIIQVPNALAPFVPLRYGDITHLRAYTTSSLAQSLRIGGFSSFGFERILPHVHGMKSWVRRVLCQGLFYPIVKGCFYLSCGSAMGGIYTPNLLAVADK